MGRDTGEKDSTDIRWVVDIIMAQFIIVATTSSSRTLLLLDLEFRCLQDDFILLLLFGYGEDATRLAGEVSHDLNNGDVDCLHH